MVDARADCIFPSLAGAYKIPTVNDVPVDFRVTLLRNAPNVRAVHSSKAVGEPPFHLGASVLFAIKDAIYACRAQSGVGLLHHDRMIPHQPPADLVPSD
jgi:xanthine dehydrogenase/oxidase